MERHAPLHTLMRPLGTSALLIRRRAIDHMRTAGALCRAGRMRSC
jgi:hypothetical protein